MVEFRLIFCCDVLYKCIAKIIVNRITKSSCLCLSLRIRVLFMQGRSIGDNILLAHELIKGYHRRTISSRCAIKAAIMKAFDSVSWDFLLNALRAIEVAEQFVLWIAACITGAHYFTIINGGLEGYIAGVKRAPTRLPLIRLSFCYGYRRAISTP